MAVYPSMMFQSRKRNNDYVKNFDSLPAGGNEEKLSHFRDNNFNRNK